MKRFAAILMICASGNAAMQQAMTFGHYDVPPTNTFFSQTVAGMRVLNTYTFGTGGGTTFSTLSGLNSTFHPYDFSGSPCISGSCPGSAPACTWCLGGGSQFQPQNNEYQYYNYGTSWPGNFTSGSAGTNTLYDANSVILRATLDGRTNDPGNVASSQLVYNTSMQPGVNGTDSARYAFEFYAKIPSGQGSWTALWFYSRDPGGPGNDASEIDLEWFQNETGADCGTNLSSSTPVPNFHGPGVGATFYSLLDGCAGTGNADGGYRSGVDLGLAYHKYQFIWTRTTVTMYIDDTQIYGKQFQWTSPQGAAFEFSNQIGTTLSGIPGVFPPSSGSYPYDYHVQRISMWRQ